MNTERPDDPLEQMEVRITALLLGEASAFEEAELLEAIKNDSGLEAYYQEMRGMVNTVEEMVKTAPFADSEENLERPALDGKRREKLEKLFECPRAKNAIPLKVEPWWKKRVIVLPRFVEIAALLAVLGVIAGILLPTVSSSRKKSIHTALQSASRREGFVEQFGAGLADEPQAYSKLQAMAGGPAASSSSRKEPDTESINYDEVYLQRYGLMDQGRPVRRKAARSQVAVKELQDSLARSSRETSDIFLPGSEGPDTETVGNTESFAFDAKGIRESGLVVEERQLKEVQLGRNFSDNAHQFFSETEALGVTPTQTAPAAPTSEPQSGQLWESEPTPPTPREPSARGRIAGTELMLGEKLKRENVTRGGRVAVGERGFGGSGGGGGDFGMNDPFAGALPAPENADRGAILATEGEARVDSYAAITDFIEPLEEQIVLSAITPEERFEVDFEPGSSYGSSRAQPSAIDLAEKPVSQLSIAHEAKAADDLTTWNISAPDENFAIEAGKQISLNVAPPQNALNSPVPVPERRPKPKPVRREISSISPQKKPAPKQIAEYDVDSDGVVRADVAGARFGYAVTDEKFGDVSEVSDSGLAPSDLPSDPQPASGTVREQHQNLNHLYRGFETTTESDPNAMWGRTSESSREQSQPTRQLARGSESLHITDVDIVTNGKELTEIAASDFRFRAKYAASDPSDLERLATHPADQSRSVGISGGTAPSPQFSLPAIHDEAKVRSRNQSADAAVRESVRRNADVLMMRQKLKDARAAVENDEKLDTTQLYQQSDALSKRVEEGIEIETTEMISDLASVRQEFAEELVERGQLGAALDQIDAGLRVDPNNAGLRELKTTSEAAAVEVLKRQPDSETMEGANQIKAAQIDASSEVQNAKLLLQMGKTDEARNILIDVAKKNPTDKEAFYYLDVIQSKRDQVMAEVQNYSERSREFGVTKARVEPNVGQQLAPVDANALQAREINARAKAAVQRGEYTAAVAWFDQSIQLADQNLGTNSPEWQEAKEGIISSRIKIAESLRDEGRLAESNEELDLALEVDAKNESLKKFKSANEAEIKRLEREKQLQQSKPSLEPRPEVQTKDNAFSTFSLNVSDVSFKLAKASLENSQLPDGSKLRSEEFVNAFDYHDPAPLPGQKLAFNWERASYPFAFDRDLLRFSIQTAAEGRQADQPLNLVVLLDNSGSMERSDRVEITRQMLAVLADQLHPNDTISVISFARTPRLWVDGMAGGNTQDLLNQVGRLNPEGGTNLEGALSLGYQIAAKHYNTYANNRVILLTDGAANLGDVDPESLHSNVVKQRQSGIALDCFGVGWEGYNDTLLETLSRNGDGRYGFINRPEDAESEFADLLAGALQVAAADVKAQVEFNPERVTSYRQIGYLQHQLTKEQFRDNTVDAAEIGAAEAGNALYVAQINENGTGPIGTMRVRYRVPSTGAYEEKEWELPYVPVSTKLENSSPALKLAGSAAAFAEWLAQSPHAAEVTLNDLQNLMNDVPDVFAPDPRPRDLQQMIQSARSISGQ